MAEVKNEKYLPSSYLYLKREKATENWGGLRQMLLRRRRWTVRLTRTGEIKSTYKILVGKTKRKRPFRKPEYEWTRLNWLNTGSSGGLF